MSKKFILGSTPDYSYISPKAPAFNDPLHSIVINCILLLALKG